MDAQPTHATAQQSGTVSVKEWMITILLTAIPIVGLVMLFIWGFGGNANPSKANWAKATLLWMAIIFGIYLIIFIIIFGAIMGGMGG